MVRPLLAVLLLAAPAVAQTPREKKVREDRVKVEADGYWIYNDLPKAFAQAKASGKPLVVILRCIPCEECVKLDDELVNTDPTLKPLLDQFVRVRVVSTNGLDLARFQFDTDQSFACFLMNADGTVYGRFGTRSHRTDWVGDVSLAGLATALRGALDLHADFPNAKAGLAAKAGPAPLFPVPEAFPALKGRFTDRLDYAGNVVKSCIHCHQIGDALREYHRKQRTPMPEDVLFPYPHPKAVGLVLDPNERATVKAVTPDTPAAKSGFRAGDRIRTLEGQPLLSIADVQWVLHRTPAAGATLTAEVDRDGRPTTVALKLPKDWRQADDISWRASTWGLRRMVLGGMKLDPKPDGSGLMVAHVGEHGPHATAKKAGFEKGDAIMAYGTAIGPRRETDVLAYAFREKRVGETMLVMVLRKDHVHHLYLPMQD